MPIRLMIELEPGKAPTVSGPLQDKILCYRLLFDAFITIMTHTPPNLIAIAKIIPPTNLKGGGQG
jgi:hypothetical protein